MVFKGKEAKGWVSTLKPRSTLVLVDEGMENVHLKDSRKVFVEMTLGKKKKKNPLLLFDVLLCALIQALIYPGPYT
jgi:hypothetical protein